MLRLLLGLCILIGSNGFQQEMAVLKHSNRRKIQDFRVVGGSSGSDDAVVTPKATAKREMLRFYGPALGIFLANPLMSNIDNAIVGRASGVAALAALSPGTVLSDQLLFLFSFLGRATTGMVSRANAIGGIRQTREALRVPLAVAFALGALFLVPTYLFLTPALLSLLQVSPALRVDAGTYAQIRGLAAPAALCQSVALSALLALRDAKTPLKVVLGAALLNLVGDIFLCIWPFQLGVGGAAAATSASTMLGCAWMIKSLQRRGLIDINRPGLLDYAPPFLSADRRRHLFHSSQTHSKDKLSLLARLRIASKKIRTELAPLVAYAGPLSAIVLARLAGFAAMSVTIASCGSVPLVAAYVLCLNIFFLFAFFAEPLSQTAQALVPPLVEATKNPYIAKEASKNLRMTLSNLGVLALSAGPIIALACALVVRFGAPLASSDPQVLDLAFRSIPAVFLMVFQLTLTTSLDGAIVGARDFSWIIACGTCTAIAQLAALRMLTLAAPAVDNPLTTPITLVFATFIVRLFVYFLASGTRIALGFGPLGRALRPELDAARQLRKRRRQNSRRFRRQQRDSRPPAASTSAGN